jgi:hypothetical protein
MTVSIFRTLAALCAILLAAGCSSKSTTPATEAEAAQYSCKRSCNRDNSVCMDSGAAQRNETIFRGDATCERQLRQCLARCGTVAQ